MQFDRLLGRPHEFAAKGRRLRYGDPALFFFQGRRVVVNNFPALPEFLHHEAEVSLLGLWWLRFGCSKLQLPFAEDQGCILIEDDGFEIGKTQRSHFAFRVGLLVLFKCRFPASGRFATSTERQFFRFPVGAHERLKVTFIPRFVLLLQKILDDLDFFSLGVRIGCDLGV